MSANPPIAPRAYLPLILSTLVLMFSGRLVELWSAPEEVLPLLLLGHYALAGALFFLGLRITRRWRAAQGLSGAHVPRRPRFELWIGLFGWAVAGLIARVLGAGLKTIGVVMGLSLMAGVALVVFAAVREAKRRARDEAAHKDRIARPFD